MMDGQTEVSYRSHRFSVAEFHRMAETGLLHPKARVELIEGEIIDMPPIGSPHAATVMFLTRCLIESAGEQALVWVQSPLLLDDSSEPQPDLMLLRPRDDFYKASHPRPPDVLLLIEVADTTLSYDRAKKVPLYAQAGIPEVWIVDVERSAVQVLCRPSGRRYGSERVTVAPKSMAASMLEGVVFDFGGFFEG